MLGITDRTTGSASLSATMPITRTPRTSIVKIEERVSPCCTKILLFGKSGVTLADHMKICEFAPVACPDCKTWMTRLAFLRHRPAGSLCPLVPKRCDICEINFMEDQEKHDATAIHISKSFAKTQDTFRAFERMAVELKKTKVELLELKAQIASVVNVSQVRHSDFLDKLSSMEMKTDNKLGEIRTYSTAEFCEFEVVKWYIEQHMHAHRHIELIYVMFVSL